MIILDTSIWIEFLKQNQKFSKVVQELLEDRKILAVECIFAELLQGSRNNQEREIIINYWKNLPKVINENLWIDAGIYSSEKKLFSKGIGLIDCVIIQSTKKNNAKLWSLDKKLNSMLRKDEKYNP